MERALAADAIAAGYAGKLQGVQQVAEASAAEAKSRRFSVAVDGSGTGDGSALADAPWGRMIAAVPGPLGSQQQREERTQLGYGLEGAHPTRDAGGRVVGKR